MSIPMLSALMYGVLPLCYEMTCETGYPIHEGLISTLISLVINTAAVTFLMVQLTQDNRTGSLTQRVPMVMLI